MKIELEINAEHTDFGRGLLLELVAAMRATAPGELFAVKGAPPLRHELEKWARLTGNAIVAESTDGAGSRWVVRHGAVAPEDDERPLGSRLWLYTNFHCNLRCDYCCVRSSPAAPPQELGLAAVECIAQAAPRLGVRNIFLTGGEPFLAKDLGAIVAACARAAPTTILTNGMLFEGARLAALRAMPRQGVVLQISVDSPTSDLHDLHRGVGTWQRAMRGIARAREEGFRVRLAATVRRDAEARALEAFFDREHVAPEDRVVRRVAARGSAEDGVAIARADLVPEVTITARGVYWHPVGAADDDMLVTRDIFPLEAAFEAVRTALVSERAFGKRLASVFRCA
jgi:hypothetical protein